MEHCKRHIIPAFYTDAAGRTVLQRSVADGGEYADTYYITDSWDNPLTVIPPEATKALAGAGSAAQDADIVDNYCYTYRYDSPLRVISKKLPGAEAHVFAYDSEGRQAFSRDGNQYGRDRRAFALYDALGRVAVTGTCQDAADEAWWSQPSSSRPAMTARRSGAASAVNRWGVACGYDWDVELNSIEILTVSYYDDYGFATDNSAMITLPQGAKASPKGLATGTLTAMLGNGGGRATSDDGISGYLLSTNFYDTEERLIETRSQAPGGGLLTASTSYTAGGVPVQTRTRLAQGDTQLTYTNDIAVDRHGRPVTSVLTRGDSGPSWTLAACTYDGIGRLSSVTAGGTLTRTTTYDIHGWMTGWETPYLSETLHYGESVPSGTTPSYTGLITAKSTQSGGQSSTYTYSYDRLGRLTSAVFSGGLPGQDFSTAYAYDLQGNMLRLTRKGLTGPRNYGLIDDVTATYTGNQLHTLRDDAPEVLLEASMDVASGTYSSGSFAYDANGNLTSDMSRDITDMEYNVLNLPCRATFADGSRIDWLYTASGQKLRQTVIAATGDTLSRRDYLGPYLFVNKELDRYQLAEGYVTPDDDFHAYIPDYQGNIVGVYNTSPNAITSIDSPLEQHTGYYPYGLPFADASNPTANRRKYGAKELTPDLGLNAYDFEARILTPAFPAFAQPDLLASLAPNLTPYRYGFNNPVNFIDPYGLFETEKEARKEAKKYHNAPVQQDKISGDWYICLNEAGDDAYTSGAVLYRYFGTKVPFVTSAQYIIGSLISYLEITQYNKTLNIWRGKNHKIYFGLSGKGPNQHTGSRSLAKIKKKKLGRMSKFFVLMSIYLTYREYDKTSKQNWGPNMQRYLRDKHIRDQFFNSCGFFGTFGFATSAGYNAGYLMEDIGQWLTNNPDFRIRLNPYTMDFTPIEKTLQEYDERGIPLY